MAKICLINPRFPTSFWGLNHGLPLLGKKCNMPVLALPTIAGLTPPEHEVTVLDENIEDLDLDALDGFDIVGVTGMSVQRDRMIELLQELKDRGHFTAVGGPWITVAEGWDRFDGLVDVAFIGEAEETWPKFLEEWQRGTHSDRYEQAEKTDMSKVPMPRYDLVKFNEYAMGCVQTSRGCPFQCEFCDIIVIFGRRPRVKTPEMVIAEVDAQYRRGARMIFLVDDNFIGNKKAAKEILRALIDWQERNGYPVVLGTEASLNLAEDDELLQLMTRASMNTVFVGIESPDEEALMETKKIQNVKKGFTMLDRVHKIQDAGIEVYAGMIVGFDADDRDVFDRQYEFLTAARIPAVMAGMLSAVPSTPLYDRLQAEGRLDNAAADDPAIATNVVPLNMTVQEMRDGWLDLMDRLYDPEEYFKRFDALFLDGKIPLGAAKMRWMWRHRPVAAFVQHVGIVIAAATILAKIWRDPRTEPFRPAYARTLRKLILRRRPVRLLFTFATRCVMHTHFAVMTRQMVRGESRLVNT